MGDVAMDLEIDDTMNDSNHRVKSKRKKPYILIIVMIAVVALLIAFIKLDIGKIASKYIAPKIENIPIINKTLPKESVKGLYDDHSKAQLINLLTGSETQLEEAEDALKDQINITLALEKQIESLEVFEKEHLKFREEKQLFDDAIAAAGQDEFIRFYEEMYPENAQNIYSDIVKVQQMTKEERKHASLISEMDAIRAAKVLENLFQTDMDIILSILSNMETESASAILEEMDSQIASTVVKQLAPE